MQTSTDTPRVASLGGNLYGDGEYLVEFENVDSTQAPLVACVLSPSGRGYTLRLDGGVKRPSVEVARLVLAAVRRDEGRES